MSKNARSPMCQIFLLLALLLPGSAFADGLEMLANGTFSSGSTAWTMGVYEGANSSRQVVNGEHVTTTTTAGTLPWHIQLTQSGMNLEQGKTYKLTFRAKAEAGRSLEVNVGQVVAPYTSYAGNFPVQLGAEWVQFSKVFTMNSSSDNNSRVEFNAGSSVVKWYLDDVSLVEVDPVEVPELVVNGGFTVGSSYWNLGVYGGANSNGQVVNGEYVTTSTSAGTEPWHVQLTQIGLKLVQGKTYKLTFQAKADAARSLIVNVGQAGTPYTSYSEASTVQLGTGWTQFAKVFTMTSPSDNNSRMEFNAGLSAIKWYLDNVSLVEVDASSPFNPISSISDIPGTGVMDPFTGRVTYLTLTSGPVTATPVSAEFKDFAGFGNIVSSLLSGMMGTFNQGASILSAAGNGGLLWRWSRILMLGTNYHQPLSVQAGNGQWIEGVNTQSGRFMHSLPLGSVGGTGGMSWPISLSYITPNPNAINQSVLLQPTSGVGFGWNFQTPSIITVHKGTVDYGDDLFIADLGPYGSGVLITSDGVNFTLNTNPTLKINVLPGSNSRDFRGWVVTMLDGTKLVFGGRDDAIRRQQVAGAKVIGPYWQGADPNITNTFAYRWDITEIRAPLNRGILRFDWQKVKAKSPQYDVESQVLAIRSCAPNFTVSNELAVFGSGEETIEKASFDWQMKGSDEVFPVSTSAANLMPDLRLMLDSRFLNKVTFNKGGTDIYSTQLQYKFKRPVVQTETVARRYLEGAVTTFAGLATEKDQWWFAYDDATGWIKTLTMPNRTVKTITTTKLPGTLQVGSDAPYSGVFKGQNASYCAGEFCYEMERGKWSVTENGTTVCPEANAVDFRVYQKTGPTMRKVLDREFWKPLGKCPPTQIYPAGNYFVAQWGQGKSGATNFDRITVFKWNGSSFTEVNPFAGDTYHANLPALQVSVAEDWFVVGLQRPNAVVEYVPVVNRGQDGWVSLNRSNTACEAGLTGAGSVAYPAAAGVSSGNGCIALSTTNGLPEMRVGTEYLQIHSRTGAFAIYRKNRNGFDNLSYRIRGMTINGTETRPWEPAWGGNLLSYTSGEDWIAASYAQSSGTRTALWRWNGTEWVHSEPFNQTAVPTTLKLFSTTNGFAAASINESSRTVTVPRFTFPRAGSSLGWAFMSVTLPGTWPAGSLGNPVVSGSGSFTAVQINSTKDWPYPLYDPTNKNRYYTYLFRDGVDVSAALIDPNRAPAGLFDLQISPDEKWLIGRTATTLTGTFTVIEENATSANDRWYRVPISSDRSLSNRGIGAPSSWELLALYQTSRVGTDAPMHIYKASIGSGLWMGTSQSSGPVFQPMTSSGPSNGSIASTSNELLVVSGIETKSLLTASGSQKSVSSKTTFSYEPATSTTFNGSALAPVASRATVKHPNSQDVSLDQAIHEYWMPSFDGANQLPIPDMSGRLKKSTSTDQTGTQAITIPDYRLDSWNMTAGVFSNLIDYKTTNQVVKPSGATMTSIQENGPIDHSVGKPEASVVKMGGTTADFGEGSEYRHVVTAMEFNAAGMPITRVNAKCKTLGNVDYILQETQPIQQIYSYENSGECVVVSAEQTTYVNYIDPIEMSVRDLPSTNRDPSQSVAGYQASRTGTWTTVAKLNQNRTVTGGVLEVKKVVGSREVGSEVTVYEGNMVLPTAKISGAGLANCAAISAEDGKVGLNNNYENGTTSPTGPRWEIDQAKVVFDKTFAHSGQYSFKVTDSYGPTRNLYLLDGPELANGVEISAWIYSTSAIPHVAVQLRDGTTMTGSYDAYPDNGTSNSSFKANRWQFWRLRLTKAQLANAINTSPGGSKHIRVFFGTTNLSGGNTVWVDDILVAPVASSAVIYGFDAQGRPVTANSKNGLTSTTEYDSRGRVQSTRDHRGRISGQSSTIPAGEN